jgi:hypothetical protein
MKPFLSTSQLFLLAIAVLFFTTCTKDSHDVYTYSTADKLIVIEASINILLSASTAPFGVYKQPLKQFISDG